MLLFVNACMREGSRTERLARSWLAHNATGEVVELKLAELPLVPLGAESIVTYEDCVAAARYDDALFSYAKQFATADEVVIAAPFWNYGIPARLHDYLELVCSQGVTFDIDETGAYVNLTNVRRLTFITTAGGARVDAQDDHAFGYVRTLARRFWHVGEVHLVAAWGLDGPDADVDALIESAL